MAWHIYDCNKHIYIYTGRYIGIPKNDHRLWTMVLGFPDSVLVVCFLKNRAGILSAAIWLPFRVARVRQPFTIHLAQVKAAVDWDSCWWYHLKEVDQDIIHTDSEKEYWPGGKYYLHQPPMSQPAAPSARVCQQFPSPKWPPEDTRYMNKKCGANGSQQPSQLRAHPTWCPFDLHFIPSHDIPWFVPVSNPFNSFARSSVLWLSVLPVQVQRRS